MQTTIEDQVARQVLAGHVGDGATVRFDVADDELVIADGVDGE
ncbi:Uncharacterised protein [Mycobacteroides abscessus subsp. abscessus]|nr:Uncharacterised protein [Mycobacteroides abscessus subsp. abscessus]